MARSFWDWQSQFPEAYFTRRHADALVARFRRYLPPGAAVLDYGCGPGELIERLLAAGHRAAGMDFSAGTRDTVKSRFAGHPRFLGVFGPDELPTSELRFGAITVIELIEHLYDDQLDELLVTLAALLEPGGVVAFTTPNEEDLAKSWVLCPATNQLFHRYQHVRTWSTATLAASLEKRGFAVEACFVTDFARRPLWQRARRALKPARKPPHLAAIARPTPQPPEPAAARR